MRIPTYNDLAAGDITASEEATGYDVENLSNHNPSSLWKATSASCTITVTNSSIAGRDFAFFNTNAEAITWTFYNGGTPVDSGTMTVDPSLTRQWLDGDDITGSGTHIVFNMVCLSGDVSAGILRQFLAISLDDPVNLQQGYGDPSIVNRTRNQGVQIKRFNRFRIVSGEVLSPVDTAGRARVVAYALTTAPYPLAIKLLEKNYTQFIFGFFKAQSSGQVFDNLLVANFNLEEVV